MLDGTTLVKIEAEQDPIAACQTGHFLEVAPSIEAFQAGDELCHPQIEEILHTGNSSGAGVYQQSGAESLHRIRECAEQLRLHPFPLNRIEVRDVALRRSQPLSISTGQRHRVATLPRGQY